MHYFKNVKILEKEFISEFAVSQPGHCYWPMVTLRTVKRNISDVVVFAVNYRFCHIGFSHLNQFAG